MPYQCLAELLEKLDELGELVRLEATVDADLEAAEVTRRFAKRGGPAVLFGAPRGFNQPILTNLLGTERRVCHALGVASVQELAQRMADAVSPPEPEGWFEKIKSSASRGALRKLPPKHVKSGPCQQVVRLGADVDLGELPVLRACPEEAGPTITAGQVILADAETGHQHAGRYDLRVVDRNRLAVCWYAHEDPVGLLAGYRLRKSKMPVAVALGGDPATLLAAMAPLGADADALALAGLLRDKPIELVAGRSIPVAVPTDAEMVLEGFIDPEEPPVDVGLLALPNGALVPGPAAPVIHVTAWTHRSNPVYPALVRGEPPNEEVVVARALQQVMLPLVRLAVPELVAYDFPVFGAARHWAFVSIRKQYAGQARRVASALWGLRQLMFVKFLVIVDEEVPVADAAAVWSAVAVHADPGRDVLVQQGPPDPWDPSGSAEQLGRRMAIDATRKLRGESLGEALRPIQSSPEVRRLVEDRWREYESGEGA
jgi:4-hydroxy-3-polyprenylbenzoate decarboxylase